MGKAELQQKAIALIEQLSTEELEAVVELLTDLQYRQAGNTDHPVEPDVEIAIKEIFKKYERAWKALVKREAVLFFSHPFVCNTLIGSVRELWYYIDIGSRQSARIPLVKMQVV